MTMARRPNLFLNMRCRQLSRCIRCTFFASDKLLEKHNFSDHNTHNYASDKVKSRHDQSRQKWRSHPKFLIAITLYSPLLLLCLFMVLHWCRVAQDGGPLTATTSTTSAPGRSSHNWAAATFFSIAARPYDVCEMTPAYAKWLRFPRESQGLTLRCAVVSSSRSHPRGKMKLRVYAKLAFRSVFDDATKMPACWKLSCTGLLMIAAGCPNELWRACSGHVRRSLLSLCRWCSYVPCARTDEKEPKIALLRRRNSSNTSMPRISQRWRYGQHFE